MQANLLAFLFYHDIILPTGAKDKEDGPSGRTFPKLRNGQVCEDEDIKNRRSREVDRYCDSDKDIKGEQDRGWTDNFEWESEKASEYRGREKDWNRNKPRSYQENQSESMERGRFVREREMGRGRGRWNSQRGSPASPR